MGYKKIGEEGYQKIPFNIQVALGNFPRYTLDTKFGYNPSVGSSQEDLWFSGGALSYLSSAETMNIASGSSDDDGSPEGSGAHTVTIVGLNGSYETISEVVTLNGMSDVETEASFIRVLRMFVNDAGAGGTNAGNITATASSASSVQAQIQAGEAQTAKIQFTVPADKVCLIVAIDIGVGAGTDALFRYKFRPLGGVFRTIRLIDTRRQSSLFIFQDPIVLDEKTDFTITASVASGTPSCSASAEYYLIDKREYVS